MSHSFFAPDDAIMQENMTVKEWRDLYHNKSKTLNFEKSDYAGVAYDAVWVYALILDKLMKQDPEALTDLHSLNTTT